MKSKTAQKFWSIDVVHENFFWLSSRTPHAHKIS